MTNDRTDDHMMHDGQELQIDSEELDASEESEDGVEELLPIIAQAWPVRAVTVPITTNLQICSWERQQEWEVTRHDSCRGALRDATWNWIERSGNLAIGDSIRVTATDHAAFDICGEVLMYDIGEHIAQVKLVEAVEGRRIGKIHRTMITKIHGTRNNSVVRDAVGVQNCIYMENFVHEANLEIDRLSRFAFATRDGDSDRDQNGRSIFIGDLVHILDIDHDYNGWIVMVSGIRPCGMLRCSLGMPPRRDRQTDEADEQARRDRPLDRNCLVRVQQCKVWGPNP